MVDGVAITDAVLDPHVLVLPIVILDRGREAHRRKASVQEFDMVAAPAEAVGAPDLADIECYFQPVGEAVEEP